MTPRTLLSWLSRAEAVTWTLLLLGMALKHLTRTTELGVRVFGLVHGVVFLAFVLVALVLWVDQRWRRADAAAVLVAGVVPLATLWVERRVERGELAGTDWRLATAGEHPRSWPERVVSSALRRPAWAALVAAAAIGVTTLVLLLVGGPPAPGPGA